MEINLQGVAIACKAREDIKAGLAVKLAPALNATYADVIQGAMLPTGAADPEAKYVAAFRVYNEKAPIYEGLPTLNASGNPSDQVYTLRSWGPSGSSNLPADVKLRMGSPRLQEEQTILSGALMLAYDEGIYTVTSGCFVSNASLIVGSYLTVAIGGKWQYSATATGSVARVFRYNVADAKLQLKLSGQVNA